MNPAQRRTRTVDVETCVRGNTGQAALCGAILVFFGFFWSFEQASGSGGSLPGERVFHWTLRGGGLLMIVAAAWCSLGIPAALLASALLSICIGLSLILSAVLMILGREPALSYPIYAVCGGILIVYGIRDLRDYRSFSSAGQPSADDAQDDQVAAIGASIDGSVLIDDLPSQEGSASRKKTLPGPAGPGGGAGAFRSENRSARR